MFKRLFTLFLGVFIIGFFLFAIKLHDHRFMILSFINGCVCWYALFTHDQQPFSIHKMNLIFILFFFVLANASQYASDSLVSTLYVLLSPNDYNSFQFILLFIIGIYILTYEALFRRIRPLSFAGFRDRQPYVFFLLAISFFATLLVLYHFRNSLPLLFVRGIEGVYHEASNDTNVASSLLFSKILRPIPFACLIWSLVYKCSRRVTTTLFILMLFSMFPTSLARYAMVLYWLPVALLLFPQLYRRNLLVSLFIVGLLFVFPFLGNFRYYSGALSFGFSFDYLNTLNYDASQEFMILMKYDLITYGKQLLGALLFFVPRSFWPGKPIGSGATLAGLQPGAWTNISMPFIAEGYINFGMVGIFIFTIVLALLAALFDKAYWYARDTNHKKSFAPFYFVIVGISVFFMRGDLMSSFSFLVAAVADLWIVRAIAFKKI